jgi:curli biogenesis system outer membrane secretion channel CsgG
MDRTIVKRISLPVLVVSLCVCAGCRTDLADPREDFVKPTVAVMKFENRSAFPLGWNLGDGMADVLVDRLVATRRLHVIERPELDSVLRELRFQNSGATRTENRAATGRLKNVQYLVKGTVTDFGHVSAGTNWLGLPNLDIYGSSNRAVMALTLYVVDVESGEIICSESLQETVTAQDLNVKVAYQNISFGGTVFYSTPLGKATSRVIEKAVRRVTETIASQPWEPKIAQVQEDNTVIINGGANRGLQVGDEFDVIEAGGTILDPDTGDVLGNRTGKTLGRVKVTSVQDRYSVAAVTSGASAGLQTGMKCRRAATPYAGLTR